MHPEAHNLAHAGGRITKHRAHSHARWATAEIDRQLQAVNDQPNGNSVATSLITAVATLVASSTATIMARLDALERGEMDRWRLHDEELARNRLAIAAKFLAVEERLDAHMAVANEHFGRQHDAASHWKDIAILAIGILGFLAVAADLAARYLGGGT